MTRVGTPNSVYAKTANMRIFEDFLDIPCCVLNIFYDVIDTRELDDHKLSCT